MKQIAIIFTCLTLLFLPIIAMAQDNQQDNQANENTLQAGEQAYAKMVMLCFNEEGLEGQRGAICNEAGITYKNGDSVQQDIARGVNLLKIACENENYISCYNLGIIYSSPDYGLKLYDNTHHFFELACANNDQDACNEANYIKENHL